MEQTQRRDGANYPLIVGLLSLVALVVLWNWPEGQSLFPADGGAAAPDAGPVADGSAPAPTVPVLSWQLEGAAMPTQEALTDCLRAGGWDRVRVLGGGARPLSVTHSPLQVPLTLGAVAGGIEVRLPLTGNRHASVSLVGAVAACAGAAATALVDPITGRHPDRSTWPSADRESGLPLAVLVRVQAGPGYLASQGLARLGLFDVLLVGPDTARNRRVLERAAVAVVLADDPAAPALTLGERTVPLVGSDAPWWPVGAPAQLRGLGDATAAFAPPPEPPPVVAPSAPRAPAPPTPRSAPPPRRAMPPTTPLFRPEYR